MSDTNISTETVEPVVDGQITGDEVTASEQQEVDYFDWNDYGDKHVKVTVAGEEIDVPLKEALSGYQRQADYTRKTQELAEQRQSVQFAQAIQQALDNDPVATIELLKNHYGLDQMTESEDDDIFVDPIEKQYRELDNRIRSFEEQQAYQELERTISSLQSKYGEDFNPNEVVSQALALGTSDLEAVYKQIAFDRLYQRDLAQRELANRRQQQDSEITEAKRVTGIVAGGTSAQNTSSGTGAISSLRDAFAAAKQQLGISQIS